MPEGKKGERYGVISWGKRGETVGGPSSQNEKEKKTSQTFYLPSRKVEKITSGRREEKKKARPRPKCEKQFLP